MVEVNTWYEKQIKTGDIVLIFITFQFAGFVATCHTLRFKQGIDKQ